MLELADGRGVFAKAGTEELSSGWLHEEARAYAAQNQACVGNADFDRAVWLPSLEAEGGPAPKDVFPDRPAEFAALIADFVAARARLPPPPTAPRVAPCSSPSFAARSRGPGASSCACPVNIGT